MIPTWELLGAVASATSLGRLPNEPRVLAHSTFPPWETTRQSSSHAEISYGRILHPPVVRSVEDYDPSSVEYFEKIWIDLKERGAPERLFAVWPCTALAPGSMRHEGLSRE